MKRVFIILLILFLSVLPVFAKPPFDKLKNPNLLYPPIKISALANKSLVIPGEEFIFHLSVIVKTGWHIYSLSPLEGNEFLRTQIFIDENVFRKKSQKNPRKNVRDKFTIFQDDIKKACLYPYQQAHDDFMCKNLCRQSTINLNYSFIH